jgi:hypothetical protein
MTTAVAAARVEVLTAEVRVLQVGSRQVTLSVCEQLDPVRPDHITPFGRVRRRPHCRDSGDDCPGDCVDVVGSDRAGTLVRCCLSRWPSFTIDGADLDSLWREWAKLPLIVLAGLR